MSWRPVPRTAKAGTNCARSAWHAHCFRPRMFRFHFLAGLGVAALGAIACSDTYETVSWQNPSASALLDDTAPPAATYDKALTFTNRRGEEVNNSAERYRFDVAAFRDDAERDAANVLYPSHAAYFAARPQALPSVQTVGTYVKQLDDTLYAGIEHVVQDGLEPSIAPKRAILSGALAELGAHRSPESDEAAIYVAAGLRLGGGTANLPAGLEPSVAKAMADFRADAAASKPIGFYTWSDSLRAIWEQDRFLQTPLPSGTCALASAIAIDPARRAHYERLVGLYGKLTNPVRSSLVDRLDACEGAPAAFLSRSRNSETELFERLYPDGVPANADLMQNLIDGIRNGAVDLAPKPEDGWYQHQSYALETLLVTDKSEERSKIGFTAGYKKRLQEAFKTMLVQHRETHVKQSSEAMPTSAPAAPRVPDFRVEPLATVYARHARSYVFLERALDDVYGKDLLDRGVVVGAGGPETESLRARLHHARDVFFGLYVVAAFDIGMKPKLDKVGDPEPGTWQKLAADADRWLLGLGKDPIAAADVRVIVPVARIDDAHTRYWAVIGVRTTLAAYSYIQGSEMTPPANPDEQARVALATEQFLEVTSSNVPPTREELRALCDANRTPEAIKAALEKR
jgi:hypothetical protein